MFSMITFCSHEERMVFIDSPFKYDIIFQRGALAQLAEQLTLNQ